MVSGGPGIAGNGGARVSGAPPGFPDGSGQTEESVGRVQGGDDEHDAHDGHKTGNVRAQLDPDPRDDRGAEEGPQQGAAAPDDDHENRLRGAEKLGRRGGDKLVPVDVKDAGYS